VEKSHATATRITSPRPKAHGDLPRNALTNEGRAVGWSLNAFTDRSNVLRAGATLWPIEIGMMTPSEARAAGFIPHSHCRRQLSKLNVAWCNRTDVGAEIDLKRCAQIWFGCAAESGPLVKILTMVKADAYGHGLNRSPRS